MTVKHTLVSLDMRVFALCSLMELHRYEKAGTCSESLYPFCTGTGSRHVRHGAFDRDLFHCAGHRNKYHVPLRDGGWNCNGAALGDRGQDRSGGDAGIYPFVDRNFIRKPAVNQFKQQNGTVICKDLKGVETGKVIRSCDDCVRDAVKFLEDALKSEN